MALHYLTFMGRKLENRKKLTPVQIMNSAGMNIVNNIGIFNRSASKNSILNEWHQDEQWLL